MKRQYLPELDGLRALSALLVITAHMHQKIWHWTSGRLGVYVFFVLSGYLITSIALNEERETGRVDLKAFYIRRAFRIFPVYYLVLATYAILIFGLHIGGQERLEGLHRAMPYYLTYFQEIAYAHSTSYLPFMQSWSLGIEEKFYLVWPVLAFLILPRFRRWAAFALAGMMACSGFAHGAVLDIIYPYSSILIGCLLAIFLERIPFGRLSRWWPCILLGVLIVQTVIIPRDDSRIYFTLFSLLIAALLGIIVTAKTPMNRLLSWKPLVWIGKVSYGVYLVHLLCLNVAERVAHNPLVAYLLACAVSVAVASTLHLCYERPLISLGRKLASGERKSTHALIHDPVT